MIRSHRRGRSPTMMQVSSQHRGQVGHSHSMSPSGPRGWVTPQRQRIGAPRGTLRSRRSIACRSRASGNHENGWDSGYETGITDIAEYHPGSPSHPSPCRPVVLGRTWCRGVARRRAVIAVSAPAASRWAAGRHQVLRGHAGGSNQRAGRGHSGWTVTLVVTL